MTVDNRAKAHVVEALHVWQKEPRFLINNHDRCLIVVCGMVMLPKRAELHV